MDKLFGASWKTTVIGLLAAVLVYLEGLGANLPTTSAEWGVALLSAIIAAFGRMSKDSNVSNAPNPDAAKPVS